MSFFDRVPPPSPEPEPDEPSTPRWARPEAEFGGVVAAELLLARSDSAAIGVSGITAYRNGFEMELVVVLRKANRRGRFFHDSFHGDFTEDPLGPEILRLGVQFADGGVATNLGRDLGYPGDDEPAGPMLMHGGGGGGDRRYDMRYWIWPLPPPGPVTFVCEWPALGIAESRAEVDGRAILDAAARSVAPWPSTG
jgi:hypothetical protein